MRRWTGRSYRKRTRTRRRESRGLAVDLGPVLGVQPRIRTDLARAVTVEVGVVVAVVVGRAVVARAAAGRPVAVGAVVDRTPVPRQEVPDQREVVQDPLGLDQVRGPVLPDPAPRRGPGAEVPRRIPISRVVILICAINKDDLIGMWSFAIIGRPRHLLVFMSCGICPCPAFVG